MTSVLIGRWCGLAELGVFSLSFTALIFALAVQEAFITSPYVVFVHRTDIAQQKRYAGSVLQQFGLLLLAVAALFALAGSATLVIPGLAPFGRMILLLAAVIPCVLLRDLARRLAFAHFKWTTALMVDIAVSALQISGIVVLGFVGKLNAATAIVGLGISTALGGGMWLLLNRRSFVLDQRRFRSDLVEHWTYGRWLCADRLTSIAYNYAVPWLVAFYAGLTAAGGLAACLSIVSAANPVLMGFANTLLPRASHSLANGGVRALREELAASFVLFTLVTAAFAITLALCGNILLRFAYGPEFVEYWPILNVLAAALLVGMLSAAADFGLRALEKPALSFFASLVGLAITVGTVLILVQSHGALGAAFGSLIGELFASLMCWLAFRRLANSQPCRETRIPPDVDNVSWTACAESQTA